MVTNLLEEIEKLKPEPGKKLLSITKMQETLATVLIEAASQEAFKIFQDNKFRHLANFEAINQTKRDRIFNELVLAALITVMFITEAPDFRVEEVFKDFFLGLKDKIPNAYILKLKELGIEGKYLKDWRKLIAMRYEEYAKDKLETRSAAMELEAKEGNLTIDSLNNIQLLLPVHAVAIGCHHHICRGKTEGKDELFKMILKWLGNFYIQIRVPFECGKITFRRKLWVKLRTLLHFFKI